MNDIAWQAIGPWRQAEYGKNGNKNTNLLYFIYLCKNILDFIKKVFHAPNLLVHPFNCCTVPVMLKYFVPAFLYCLYNNLAFVNLSAFDPTTYYLMLQLRVVVTGVLFQVFLESISVTIILNLSSYLPQHSNLVYWVFVFLINKKNSACIE